MSRTPFLQAVAVTKLYSGQRAAGVKRADLTIKPGKITAIIGESGSGKSTLLRLFYGLLSPDNGAIYFKGDAIIGPEEKLIPGHDAMKMVTQDTDGLNVFAKVWDNIAVMLPNTDVKAKERKTEKVLKQLNMYALAGKRVADLSGGEKQRVAIARALVTQPEVLLLDEPFNQVDTSFRDGLQQNIREIVKDTGLTVIMVSHDPGEVLSMADELLVLKDGEIIESGNPKELYQSPKHLYTAQLLSNCNVLTNGKASLCGINSELEHIVIYPEWLTVADRWLHKSWEVRQILFKGPYEELVMERAGVILHVFNSQKDKYPVGALVHLKIGRYLEF